MTTTTLTVHAELPEPTRISTRQRVVTLRSHYPTLPAVRIAELLSISRERVRQILKTEGLLTRIKPDYGDCIVCGTALEIGRKSYCSMACKSADCRVTFRCDYCGHSKEILQSVYNAQKRRGYQYMYCSIRCWNNGKWTVRKLKEQALIKHVDTQLNEMAKVVVPQEYLSRI